MCGGSDSGGAWLVADHFTGYFAETCDILILLQTRRSPLDPLLPQIRLCKSSSDLRGVRLESPQMSKQVEAWPCAGLPHLQLVQVSQSLSRVSERFYLPYWYSCIRSRARHPARPTLEHTSYTIVD